MDFLYQWIDIIWLPLALYIVQKQKRWLMAAFIIANMVMMRLLVELMDSIGYPAGILPLMTSPVFDRALMTYTVFNMLFIILAHYSPRTHQHVFIGAGITVFFMAAVTSTLIMLL